MSTTEGPAKLTLARFPYTFTSRTGATSTTPEPAHGCGFGVGVSVVQGKRSILQNVPPAHLVSVF